MATPISASSASLGVRVRSQHPHGVSSGLWVQVPLGETAPLIGGQVSGATGDRHGIPGCKTPELGTQSQPQPPTSPSGGLVPAPTFPSDGLVPHLPPLHQMAWSQPPPPTSPSDGLVPSPPAPTSPSDGLVPSPPAPTSPSDGLVLSPPAPTSPSDDLVPAPTTHLSLRWPGPSPNLPPFHQVVWSPAP